MTNTTLDEERRLLAYARLARLAWAVVTIIILIVGIAWNRSPWWLMALIPPALIEASFQRQALRVRRMERALRQATGRRDGLSGRDRDA